MDYHCITDIDSIIKYIAGATAVAFDFETAPMEIYRQDPYAALDPHKADIVGVSLSKEPGSAIYIPLKHRVGENAKFDQVMELLKNKLFLCDDIIKIAHNLNFEAMFLYKYGIILSRPVYDTIAASQLTLKSDHEFRTLQDSGLKTLVPEIYEVEMVKFEDVTGGKHFDELDPSDYKTISYACADSDYAYQLYNTFNDWFRRFIPEHEYVVRYLESPTAVFVGLMKYNGIKADKLPMYEKQLEAEIKISEIRGKIYSFAGRALNIGSNAATHDFKRFLYEEMGLPVLKTTAKYKDAADDEALILLKDYCRKHKPEVVEFIESIQAFRKWSKLKSTYIDGIINFINPVTGGVHTDFFPLGTETGRFASRKPNLQNIPRKDNDPIGIRNFFIAREGHKLVSFDFSQIELRVAGFYCRDERMLETFRNDGDIHAETTSVIYHIPFEEASNKSAKNYKERRSIAKNCIFGSIYGLFPRGLQGNLKFKAGLDVTLSECEEIINNLKSGYPKLKTWQSETVKRSRANKYTKTLYGRRRYINNIESTDWGKRSYSERCALNTPIQGTAADILKVAMTRLLAGLGDRTFIKPLLTIHDEIVFEVPNDKVEDAVFFIKNCMELKPFDEFDVPIKAEGAVGFRFGELEELK